MDATLKKNQLKEIHQIRISASNVSPFLSIIWHYSMCIADDRSAISKFIGLIIMISADDMLKKWK